MANKTVYPYGTDGQLPSSIGIINDLVTGGADNALSAEMGKFIGDLLGESTITEAAFSGMTHYKDGYQLRVGEYVGSSLDSCATYAGDYVNVKIPVTGFSKVNLYQYNSGYNYGSCFINSSNVIVSAIIKETGSGTDRILVDIPSTAEYLVYSYYTGNSRDRTVYLYTEDGIIPQINELKNREVSVAATVSVSGKSPALTSGKLNSSGNVVAGEYLTTETIFGSFFIKFADGWKMYEAHLYDRAGNMVSYQHIHPDVYHQTARGNRTFMSTDNMVPDYGMRITLCKSDGSAVEDGAQPITNFVLLSDSGLHRWIPSDLPKYDTALRRVDYLEHLRWIPLAKVPNGYPDSSSASATNTANEYFDIAGRVAVGPPYSDVAETRKYVPNNVSLRTFMTAVKNKRSLLYTEELHKNTSKYGMTYKQGHRRAYYGEVCCGLTAWVMGMDTMYLSGDYGSNNVPGLSSVTYNSVNDLRPLDLISQDGHISIISDIWKDEFGNVKYIAWAEMSTPYPYRGLLTPEQFNARLTSISGTVHRWTGWENLKEPEDSEYSQYFLGQTRKEPEWSGDIMCFAGDYAAFAEGDIIHLNARRNSTYTGVELYKNDVLLQTIDITGLSADSIVTPNTEDWVDVNLTSLNLAYGKYKARLTDGTNTTDYTYFEVIDITFTATKVSSSSISITVGSNEGTPITVEKVRDNGFTNAPSSQIHAITAEEVTSGTFTLSWSYNSTYKYLLMLVKGDYGIVSKMISFPA